MIKKTITYTDYFGKERTGEYFFHINEAEAMELELSVSGGLSALAKKAAATDDKPELIKIFKELIMLSYGEKSPDGNQFVKVNDAGVPLSRAFSQTPAYPKLFMELATDDTAASEFFNGIMPNSVKNAR